MQHSYQDSPRTSRALGSSGKITSIAAVELFDSPSNLDTSDERHQHKVLQPDFLLRMHVGGIEEIIEVFFPLFNYKLT